jgi:hypothetical protein
MYFIFHVGQIELHAWTESPMKYSFRSETYIITLIEIVLRQGNSILRRIKANQGYIPHKYSFALLHFSQLSCAGQTSTRVA